MKLILKNFYLLYFKIVYKISGVFYKEKENNILFISTFTNSMDEIDRNISHFFYKKNYLNPDNISIIKQAKLLRKAKYVYVDNYYVGFAAINSDEKVITQVWHANGAIKKFCLAKHYEKNMSPSDIERYKKVYDSFTYITTSSKKMEKIYMESFDVSAEKFLRVGNHRADKYYGNKIKEQAEKLSQLYQNTLTNLNILYVPTFREDEKENLEQLKLIEYLEENLPSYINVYYTLHPNVKKLSKKFTSGIEVEYEDLSAFIQLSNLVITDYSSLTYDAILSDKPLAFYIYDYEDYEKIQGLNVTKDQMPGYVSSKNEEILKYILSEKYDKSKNEEFKKVWNEYNNGKSAREIVLKTLGEKKLK